jgi:valyl-tRNA synthetase
MPFLTEELWSSDALGEVKRDTCLALAAWPHMHDLEDAAAEAEIGFVIDVISEVRSVRSEMNVPAAAQIPLVFVGADSQIVARVSRWDETIRRLARISEISFASESPAQSAQLIMRGTLAALPLAGIIDFAAEGARLRKEIDKLAVEAEKLRAKLGNEDFIARAPEEVVEENRERLADAVERREKLAAALTRLG